MISLSSLGQQGGKKFIRFFFWIYSILAYQGFYKHPCCIGVGSSLILSFVWCYDIVVDGVVTDDQLVSPFWLI